MVTAVEIADFLRREFPQTRCVVEAVGDGTSTVSHEITVQELRSGGTVAGKTAGRLVDNLQEALVHFSLVDCREEKGWLNRRSTCCRGRSTCWC